MVGESREVTPKKHDLLRELLGMDVSRRALHPRNRTYTYIELGAGDGSRSCSGTSGPLIASEYARRVDMSCIFVEKDKNAFKYLKNNKNIVKDRILGDITQPQTIKRIPDLRDERTFVFADPNCAHEWMITEPLLNKLGKRRTILATMGFQQSKRNPFTYPRLGPAVRRGIQMMINWLPEQHDMMIMHKKSKGQFAFLYSGHESMIIGAKEAFKNSFGSGQEEIIMVEYKKNEHLFFEVIEYLVNRKEDFEKEHGIDPDYFLEEVASG